jgi:histidyl-tRNA synthetase
MAADAECVALVYTALTKLGFADFTIKINNRKLLTGIGIYAGVPDDQLGGLYRSIDKTDKIGLKGVAEDLRKNGIADDVIERMIALLEIQTDDKSALLGEFRGELADIEIAQEGLAELDDLLRFIAAMGVPEDATTLDFTMVRGLGYYTGPIFETIITKPENLGSVQGGGRYDELIGMFRHQSLPMTGISLGVERLIDLMDQLDLFPSEVGRTVVQVMVVAFSEAMLPAALQLTSELRAGGLRAETYLDERKSLGKQLGYADGKGVRLAAILGPDELEQGVVNLKHLQSREEITVPRAEVVAKVRNMLDT